MAWTTTGADVATMVTGASALTAVLVWGRNQVARWQEQRLARAHKAWNGYIDVAGVDTWGVQLVEGSANDPPERVIVDVVNSDGTANIQMAHRLRSVIDSDRYLSRSPSPDQLAFLIDLKRQRPQGYPVQ